MNQPRGFGKLSLAVAALAATALAGCGDVEFPSAQGPPASRPIASRPAQEAVPVPAPLDLLLPRAIRIHPFTGTRVFGEAGGITGIDVRIEAIDGYGDANKAFGRFRFELFRHKPNSAEPKGERLAVWNVSAADHDQNRHHWNSITRTYQFKLAWDESIPIGRKFVLLAVFDSRFTPRLFDERVFVSGQ